MREGKKPRQASLRRAVSAAYYALFHLLTADRARFLSPAKPIDLRMLVGRAFEHGHMRQVCAGFVQGNAGQPGNKSIPSTTRKLLDLPLQQSLVVVLQAFVDLQEARHQADYDLTRQWNRLDVLTYVGTARQAFTDWAQVRRTPNAAVVMAALLLQKQWAK
jgi:hypothetical protein